MKNHTLFICEDDHDEQNLAQSLLFVIIQEPIENSCWVFVEGDATVAGCPTQYIIAAANSSVLNLAQPWFNINVTYVYHISLIKWSVSFSLFLSFSAPPLLSPFLLSQEKNKPQDCVRLGVASTGLQISEVTPKSWPVTSFMPCV